VRGETVTIVGLALWLRPVPAKQVSTLRLRLERRRQWLVEQERQRLINAANAAAEREERALRFLAEGEAAEQDDDEFYRDLPMLLRPQAG